MRLSKISAKEARKEIAMIKAQHFEPCKKNPYLMASTLKPGRPQRS